MSVRRKTNNRLTLYRTCVICGKSFVTTADTPWMRLVYSAGHSKTCYYCSETCKQASYKHLFDGKAAQRKAERDAQRDTREKNRRYYIAHQDQERERAKARYWADPERARADNEYQRRKRKARVYA